MATAGTCTVIPRTAEVDFWSAQISWYPAHTHPLTVSDRREGRTGCRVCKQSILADECAYGCESCKYYLHISCLPRVHIPVHPQHPLIAMYESEGASFCCQICTTVGFLAFRCDSCDIYVCTDCAPLVPEWRFEHEGHPFASIEIGYNENSDTANLIRNACQTCGKKGDTKFFKCLYPGCPNYCHFHCIPFDVPQTTKHEYHYHPLTFAESFAEEGIKVHYCDACEEERDPKAAVYRCAECNFNAHTACAISKVLPALIAEREANPSKLVSPPFCGDPTLEKLNDKIEELVGKEKSLKVMLEHIKVKLGKAERVFAALMQRKEQGNEL